MCVCEKYCRNVRQPGTDGVKQTATAMGNTSCVTETIDQCGHIILA